MCEGELSCITRGKINLIHNISDFQPEVIVAQRGTSARNKIWQSNRVSTLQWCNWECFERFRLLAKSNIVTKQRYVVGFTVFATNWRKTMDKWIKLPASVTLIPVQTSLYQVTRQTVKVATLISLMMLITHLTGCGGTYHRRVSSFSLCPVKVLCVS